MDLVALSVVGICSSLTAGLVIFMLSVVIECGILAWLAMGVSLSWVIGRVFRIDSDVEVSECTVSVCDSVRLASV